MLRVFNIGPQGRGPHLSWGEVPAQGMVFGRICASQGCPFGAFQIRPGVERPLGGLGPREQISSCRALPGAGF
jgi:hypothetical protein